MRRTTRSAAWMKLNGLLRYFLAHTATGLLPLYVINEYPKSGGSWIGEMLSDALDIPFPRNRLPMVRASILHGHMMHSWNMHNILLVWRDGRDILISQYYHFLFENDRGNAPLVKKCRADLGFKDYEDIARNLGVFMEYVYERNRHPRMTWAAFVNRWADCETCAHTRYESLRHTPVVELQRIVMELSGVALSDLRAQEIVQRHSFEKVAGRNTGEVDIRSFLRKGIVGDWRNYFTAETMEQFRQYAGQALIKLRYEQNDDWVTSSHGPTP